MRRKRHFYLALRQGGICQSDADKIMELLSVETLKRITENQFDKRLIHPVLLEAGKRMENAEAGADDGGLDFETAVKQILDNQLEMFELMAKYCL